MDFLMCRCRCSIQRVADFPDITAEGEGMALIAGFSLELAPS